MRITKAEYTLNNVDAVLAISTTRVGECHSFTQGLYWWQTHSFFCMYIVWSSFGEMFMHTVVVHKITNNKLRTCKITMHIFPGINRGIPTAVCTDEYRNASIQKTRQRRNRNIRRRGACRWRNCSGTMLQWKASAKKTSGKVPATSRHAHFTDIRHMTTWARNTTENVITWRSCEDHNTGHTEYRMSHLTHVWSQRLHGTRGVTRSDAKHKTLSFSDMRLCKFSWMTELVKRTLYNAFQQKYVSQNKRCHPDFSRKWTSAELGTGICETGHCKINPCYMHYFPKAWLDAPVRCSNTTQSFYQQLGNLLCSMWNLIVTGFTFLFIQVKILMGRNLKLRILKFCNHPFQSLGNLFYF